jgi:hemerythrin-like domain-containing protein
MAEHAALTTEAFEIRQALNEGDHVRTASLVTRLAGHLSRHAGREEAGLFTALRDKAEFLDELLELEAEHLQLGGAVTVLDHDADNFVDIVTCLLDDLSAHIEREELGVFPVSVVTLGIDGWDVVERSHSDSPSFLRDPSQPE